MQETNINNDDIILIEYIDNTIYGKLAHFFSVNEGNYYSKVIDDNNMIIYDRLSKEEQNEFINTLNINKYKEEE